VPEKERIGLSPEKAITPTLPIAVPTFSLEADALFIKVPLDINAIEFTSKQIDVWLNYAKSQIETKKPKIKKHPKRKVNLPHPISYKKYSNYHSNTPLYIRQRIHHQT